MTRHQSLFLAVISGLAVRLLIQQPTVRQAVPAVRCTMTSRTGKFLEVEMRQPGPRAKRPQKALRERCLAYARVRASHEDASV